jgi:uncharacterized protein
MGQNYLFTIIEKLLNAKTNSGLAHSNFNQDNLSPNLDDYIGFNPIFKVSGNIWQSESSIDRRGLLSHLQGQFKLDWYGMQGVTHWARVRANGLMLAKVTGANKHVVELYAFFHAACLKHENEEEDPEHRERAKQLAKQLHMVYFDSTEGELNELMQALTPCSTQPRFYRGSDTLATCWDADALDLWRFGTAPSGIHDLITQQAKRSNCRDHSQLRSQAWLNKWSTSSK